MFNKYNKKKEKLLSTLIAFSLSFSSFGTLSTSLAAQDDAATAAQQSAALEGLANQADKNIANTIANGGEEAADEMESALQKANARLMAEKNDAEQQKNSTTKSPKVYTVTRDGSIVTVTENPCYQVTTATKECPMPTEMWNISSKNSKGVYENRSVPKSTLQYIASDGKEIDGKMMNMIYMQKSMDAPSLNSDGTVSKTNQQRAVMSTMSAVVSELGKSDLSASQKFMFMMAAYQNAMANAQKLENEAMKAEEDIKAAEVEKQKAWDKIETVQAEREVIKTANDFPYKVRLNPVLPTITDKADVEITLIPKNNVKNASSNQDKKYTVEVQFESQEQPGHIEKLTVKEGKPFIVELGKNPNRTVGSRTIKVILRYADNSAPKSYTFSYKVSQYRNVLVANGKTISNSVMGVFVNADLAELNGDRISVAGKITSAKVDENGQCRIRLKDGIGGEDSSTPQMDVLTTAVSQDKCEKLVGTYASFGRASVRFNETTGRYEMLDESDDSNRSIGMGYDGYMQGIDANAETTQKETSVGLDVGVVKYNSGDSFGVGLAGAAGINWTNINGENISVYTDKDGNLQFGKPVGVPYSPEELARKSMGAGIDLSKATITKDANGMLVVKSSSGTVMNKNEYTKETFYNLSRKGNSIGNSDNLYTPKKHGEKMSQNGGLSYKGDEVSFVEQVAQQTVSAGKNLMTRNVVARQIPAFSKR